MKCDLGSYDVITVMGGFEVLEESRVCEEDFEDDVEEIFDGYEEDYDDRLDEGYDEDFEEDCDI